MEKEIRYYSLALCGIIFLVFLLQSLFPAITDGFKLVSADIMERPWILITSIFLHADIVHLLYNLFGLALFGSILEAKIGSKPVLTLFFISGIIAGFAAIFFYNSALGASGAVFGIIGALAVMRPGMVVWVSYMPMPMFVAAFFWAVGDIFGLFMPGNIANAAHLGGLAAGILYGFYLRVQLPEEKKAEKVSLNISESEWNMWEEKYMLKNKQKQKKK